MKTAKNVSIVYVDHVSQMKIIDRWRLSEPVMANERNRAMRKEKYKVFWTMLFHRGVLMDTRYKSQKIGSWQADPRLGDVVCHRRDILPQCV